MVVRVELVLYNFLTIFSLIKCWDKSQPTCFVISVIILPIFTTSIFASFIGHTLLHFCWIIALGLAVWLEQKAILWYQQHGFL